MAKKQDEFEVDLLGDFGDDIDFFNDVDDSPLTRIEKAKRFTKGMGGGILDRMRSSDFIIKTLNRAIPDSYNVDLTVLSDVKRTAEDLFRDAGDEATKLNDSFKRATRGTYDEFSKNLPKNVRERLDKYYEEEARSEHKKVSEEDSFVGGKLEELLRASQAKEEIRHEEEDALEARRDVLNDRRHRDMVGLSEETNETLQRLVNFQTKVTSNYQRRSLELGLRHYYVAGKTLQLLTENAKVTQDNLKALHTEISKPDILKLREHKDTRRLYGGNRGERGLFGNVMNVTSRIRDNAEKRIRDAIQATVSGLGMGIGLIEMGAGSASSMGQFGDTHTMAGGMAGEGAADVGGYLVGNRIRKFLERHKGSQRLGKKVSYFTGNYRNMLEEARRGETFEYDDFGNPKVNFRTGIAKLLHGLIGDERGTINLENDTLESLQQAHPFTKQTSRTINEVIPGLLTDIRSVLIGIRTGKDGERTVYDYLSGKFISQKDHHQRVKGDLLANARGDVVKYNTEQLINDLDQDGKLSDEDRRELGVFLLKQSHERRLASKDRLTNIDTYEGLPPEQAERFRQLFSDKFEGEDPHGFIEEFSRKYNTLLNSSQITRDHFHALMQTGQHEALKASGFVKDGQVNTDALMRAFLEYDYDDVHDDTRQAINDKINAENQAQREAHERAQTVAKIFRRGKDKFDETKLGKTLNEKAAKVGEKIDTTTEAVIEQTREIIEASGVKDLTKEQVIDLMREVKDQGLEKAQNMVDTIRETDYQGAADAIVEGFKEAREDPRGTYARVKTQGKREARGVWARMRRLGRRAKRGLKDNAFIQAKAQALHDQYGRVSQSVMETAQRIMTESGIVQPSRETIGRVIQDVKDKMADLGIDGENRYVSHEEAITTIAGNVSKEVKSGVKGLFDRAKGKVDQSEVKKELQGVMDKARDKVNQTIPEATRDRIDVFKDQTLENFRSANDALRERAQAALNRARGIDLPEDTEDVDASAQYVAETQAEVGETLASKLDQIKDAVLSSLDYQRERDAGPRKGSFEDIMQERSKKKKEEPKRHDKQEQKKEESGFGLVSMLFKGLKSLTGLVSSGFSGLMSILAGGLGVGALGKALKLGKYGLGGALKGGGALLGGTGKLAGWLGGKSKIGKLLSGLLTGAGGLVSGAGGSVLGTGGVVDGLKQAGGLAGEVLNPIKGLGRAGRVVGGLGSLLKTAAVGAGKGLLTAGRFALPLLTNPIFLGVAGAAAVGYGAYKWFTRVKLNPINQMRLVQYGYQGDDLDSLKRVMAMEEQLGRGVTFDGGGIPRVNYQNVDLPELLKACGIDPKDTEAFHRLDRYLIQRFVPIYLTHVGVLQRIAKKIDLKEAEKLKGEDLIKYVEGASYPEGPYEPLPDPITGEPLPSGRDEVIDFVKSAKLYAEEAANKQAAKKDRNAKILSMMKTAWDFTPIGMAVKAANKVFGFDKQAEKRLMEEAKGRPETHYGEAMLKELGAGGKLTNLHERMGGDSTDINPVNIGQRLTEVFADAGVVSVSSYVTRRFIVPEHIRAEDAIRYKLYGLKTMTVERIRTLLELEYTVEQDVDFDADGKATWKGSLDALAALYVGKFGLGTIQNPATEGFMKWLKARFMPVFLNALSYVYQNTKSTSLEDGKLKLTPSSLSSYVNTLTGTMSIDPDTDKPCSVWEIPYSPWGDDDLNVNPASIEANLVAVKDRVKDATAIEEGKTKSTAKIIPGKTLSQPNQYGNRQVTSQMPTTGYLSDLDGYQMGGAPVAPGMPPGLMGYNEPVRNYDANPWGETSFELGQTSSIQAKDLPNPRGDGSYQAYADMISVVANAVGVDEATLAAMVSIESGFKAQAKAPTSTASGLGQFIKSTWDEMVTRYGAQYGIARGTSPFDPKANLLMTAQFIRNNAEILKRETGLTRLRPVDLYMSHFLGAGGYAKFIKAGPQAVAAHVDPKAANANRNVFYDSHGRPRAVGEVVAHFSKKLSDRATSMGVQIGGGLGLQTDLGPQDLGQEPNGNGLSVVDAGQGLPNPYSGQPNTQDVIEQSQQNRLMNLSTMDDSQAYRASAQLGTTGQTSYNYQMPTGGSGMSEGSVASGDKVKAFVATLNPKYIELGMKYSYVQNSGVDLKGMNKDFMLIFYAMVGEYVSRGGSKVQINSAFRSVAKQRQLYEAWIAGGKRGGAVAKPGNSRHGKGIAIDINSSSANALHQCGLLRKYNFHRPVKGEAWHLENYLFGDAKATQKAMAEVSQEAKAPSAPAQSDRIGYLGDASDPQGVNVQDVIANQTEATQRQASYSNLSLTPEVASEVTQQQTVTENNPTQKYQGQALELAHLQLEKLGSIHSVLLEIHKLIPNLGIGPMQQPQAKAPTTQASRTGPKPSSDLLKPAVSMNRQI